MNAESSDLPRASPVAVDPTQVAMSAFTLPSAFLHVHHAFDHLRPWLDGRTTVSWLVRGFSVDKPMTVLHQTFTVAYGSPESLSALSTLGRVGISRDLFITSMMRLASARFCQSRDLFPTFTTQRLAVCDDDAWRSDPFVRQFIQPADLGNTIATVTRICQRNDIYLLSFVNRPWKSSPFESRHVAELDDLSRALAPAFAAAYSDMSAPCEASQRDAAIAAAQLTEAQRRLLPLLLSGLTEKEIAQHLHRSHHTVHTHAREIYRALGLSGRRDFLSRCVLGNLRSQTQGSAFADALAQVQG